MLRLLFIATFSIVLVTVAGIENRSVGQEFKIDELQTKIYAAIDRAMPAIVAVRDKGVTFSGVIVSAEGHVVSAGHAVDPGEDYQVILPDGRILPAKGLGSNRRIDCAMIKIIGNSGLPHAELANSSKVVVDQPCVSISHPGIYEASRGAVVRFGHVIKPVSPNQGMIQSTALMEPGDSGGGLFDLDGKLLAVHSNIGESLDYNFDVPANTYREFWDELNKAERFDISGIPSAPKLGINVERTSDRKGLRITSVTKDSIAETIGLKEGDILRRCGKRTTTSIYRFRRALMEARSNREGEFTLVIDRDDTEQNIKVKHSQLISSRIPIPSLSSTTSTLPRPIPELSKLTERFEKLESQLDNQCIVVESELGNRGEEEVLATTIKNQPYLISKSSRIGESPFAMSGDEKISLKVIARDPANDLVLLRAPRNANTGVNLFGADNLQSKRGLFVISPDPDGDGYVSVGGTQYFSSVRRESKGFLGVRSRTADDRNGVILDEVLRGGARDAGLKSGDVIVRLDNMRVTSSQDLLRFLGSADPFRTIEATFKRDGESMTRKITLGSPRPKVNHVAERMRKSGRRDGFPYVFSHDGTLRPRECGGPVYDLNGNFLGINIARKSRTQTYAVPKSVILGFYSQHAR